MLIVHSPRADRWQLQLITLLHNNPLLLPLYLFTNYCGIFRRRAYDKLVCGLHDSSSLVVAREEIRPLFVAEKIASNVVFIIWRKLLPQDMGQLLLLQMQLLELLHLLVVVNPALAPNPIMSSLLVESGTSSSTTVLRELLSTLFCAIDRPLLPDGPGKATPPMAYHPHPSDGRRPGVRHLGNTVQVRRS